ncbi:VIR protein [Plasmodium vivax]|uniref:VIR protein n=1 Tax=Plasmodium vivax TaxID=5855 RepID=A0A1G4H621_PLAVI|nr:VIR protein [Plasmodium vivax]
MAESCSEDLPSQSFYKSLGEYMYSLDEYDQYCVLGNSNYQHNESVKSLCRHLLKNLNHNSQINVNESVPCNHYKLLSYWLYNQIEKVFTPRFVETERKKIYEELTSIWKDFVSSPFRRNLNNCQPEPVTVFDDDDNNNWKVRKEFYEYCEDYNTLKKSCTHSFSTCGKYYDYLENKSDLYNQFLTLNLNKPQDKYSSSYEKYKKFDPRTLLDNLPCTFEMSPDGKREYVKTRTTKLYQPRVQPVAASPYRVNQEQKISSQASSHPEVSRQKASRLKASRLKAPRLEAPRQAAQYQAPPYQTAPYEAALHKAAPRKADLHEEDPHEENQYKAYPYQASLYRTTPHQEASYQEYLEPAGDDLETSTSPTERATINLPLIALSVILLLLTISFTIDFTSFGSWMMRRARRKRRFTPRFNEYYREPSYNYDSEYTDSYNLNSTRNIPYYPA